MDTQKGGWRWFTKGCTKGDRIAPRVGNTVNHRVKRHETLRSTASRRLSPLATSESQNASPSWPVRASWPKGSNLSQPILPVRSSPAGPASPAGLARAELPAAVRDRASLSPSPPAPPSSLPEGYGPRSASRPLSDLGTTVAFKPSYRSAAERL